MTTLMQSLHTLLRHRWRDESDARRTLPPEAMERLKQRVAASERRHTGQIRIAVEAGLPSSYLWRHIRKGVPLRRIVRERAVMLFGKLRVWDTERNNGVLISRVRHQVTQVVDSYRPAFKFATTAGSTGLHMSVS